MNKIYPEYTSFFTCLAGNCPDTCCAGWEIVIDDKFQNLYRESSSNAAKKAVAVMYTDSDGDVCLKLENGRCPMLNSDNLCKLYIDMGENALCNVCRIYPRYHKITDNAEFGGISLSCPEAARLILNDNTYGDTNNNIEFNNTGLSIYADIYGFIRNVIINHNIWDIMDISYDIDTEMQFGIADNESEIFPKYSPTDNIPDIETINEIYRCIDGFDILTDKWKAVLNKLKVHIASVSHDDEYRQKRDKAISELSKLKELKLIAIYYLYKYLPEAIDENDILLNTQAAYVSSAIICEIYAMEQIESGNLSPEFILRAAQLYAKEIEHNEDNINKLMTEEFMKIL